MGEFHKFASGGWIVAEMWYNALSDPVERVLNNGGSDQKAVNDMTLVRYKRNPLISVVCQLRFPPILTISEVLPALFQEEVRHQYPQFKSLTEQQFHFNFEQDQSEAFSASTINQTDTAKNYHFASEDDSWGINLTNTFLAVTTSNYSSCSKDKCWR